jgi:hypothetical protein
MSTLEKINTSPLCIYYMLTPQIILLLLSLMLVYTWYEESTPHDVWKSALLEFGKIEWQRTLKALLR